jgi:hypothetical protein
MSSRVRLPAPRTSQPPAPFQPGDLVRLKNSPHGPAGRVSHSHREWISVKWSDMPRLCRHRADSLVLAGR